MNIAVVRMVVARSVLGCVKEVRRSGCEELRDAGERGVSFLRFVTVSAALVLRSETDCLTVFAILEEVREGSEDDGEDQNDGHQGIVTIDLGDHSQTYMSVACILTDAMA